MEVLIVLIILTVVLSWSARKMFNRKGQIKASLQTISRLNRSLDIRSRLHEKTYRLVFRLNPEGPEEFWVEKQTADTTFIPDTMLLKAPKTLHPALSIVSVESENLPESKTEGPIYIHYHPRGPGQETALYMERRDSGAKWTLYFHPVERELTAIKNHIPLKEIKE